jgi:hypothetical protein
MTSAYWGWWSLRIAREVVVRSNVTSTLSSRISWLIYTELGGAASSGANLKALQQI